jgi:hypothetical protein
MAAITYSQIVARREALMRAASRVAVIILKPEATDDATASVYLVKDPDPGDAPVTTTTAPGNAKGGNTGGAGYSWKQFSYAALETAYGL